MKRSAIVYFATLVVLLPLDFLFLGSVGKKMFDQHIGELMLSTPRMAPAIAFYVLYIAGIVIFVNGAAPGDWQHNALYGALFGLSCYATFELTNMAILRQWDWALVGTDIAWGAAMTAAAAALGGLLAQWTLAKIG
ncbi:DUF2177 family protein [Rhodopseudomonas pseudopalustris]|uniref:Uncharacterized membrane protein n=1 Tax=Rhodopseudomonas pseudopalustris TaxID=1513892 RepID=A0A1H8Q285_9BRAD|nr:DUF2177 family protein [Rhodopseudomonas pseudopalustris]SEO47873.1 Uncharacterized membrane protein [Rhodopseudomonas pseudopalustris]